MSTPAKKAVPSLKDLTNKDDDAKENNNPPEEVTDPAPDESVNKENAASTGENLFPTMEEVNAAREAKKNQQGGTAESVLSKHVVATLPNKTPAELAAETPQETETRYGGAPEVSEETLRDRNVAVYKDDAVWQTPSSTHLHPDVVKDLAQRGIARIGTDNAQVRRDVNEGFSFAGNAEHNDKF